VNWLKQLFSGRRLYGELSEEIRKDFHERSRSWLRMACQGKKRSRLPGESLGM